MAFISAAQQRADLRAMKLQQEAALRKRSCDEVTPAQGERGGAEAECDKPSECRALVLARPWVGAGFAKARDANPPLFFSGGDRREVADAEASVQVSRDGHHPQTPSSGSEAGPEGQQEGASACTDDTTPDRRTVFLPALKSRFLEHLSEFGNVGLACKRAGVSRQTAYRERRRQPAFARLWDAAMLSARTVAEEALAERAVHGVEEPVFYHGEEVGHRRRFSDRLLLAHLGRLDRIEAKPEVSAALATLDDAIAALGRGEELGGELGGELREQAAPQGGENDPLNSVPHVPLGPDHAFAPTSSRAAAGQQGYPPCETCGGPCDEPFAELTAEHCMWLGNRLDRMNAARPRGVPKPHELGAGIDESDRIEGLQLDAFECDMPEWWTVTSEEELEERLSC
uniref:hypothetical protein n=1 Tax=Parerythrobacter lutipelagi TaxID=1964208 RepID=UPI001375CF35|nr:hypothetical protein [Parerythrobacter lutipelagi]